MKSFIKLTLAVILFGVIFTSCSSSNEPGKMIPKNALIVMHINSKSLLSKVSWDEIKQTSWFKELYKDTANASFTKKLMENPENTGIDLKSGFIIFLQKPSGTEGQVVFEGDIKDAKSFEEFNKNLDATAISAKDGEVTTLVLKRKTVVGWKGKKFAYIINSPSPRYSTDDMQDTSAKTTPAVSVTEKLSRACKNLFALSADNNMEKNIKFGSFLKEEGDIHVWQNTEELVNSSGQSGMLGMPKLDVFLKGNIATTIANFENGKIDVKQKLYAGKEFTDLLKKYGGGKINTDMIKNIPSQNITGLISIHFAPEGIREIIKLAGLDGLANIFLSKQGISVDDFVKANKGDILFAASDFTMKKDSFNFKNEQGMDSSYSHASPLADYLFAVSIGDKASFDKLLNAGKKMSRGMSDAGIAYANNDKFFAIGSSQSAVSKYLAGGNNSFTFLDKIKDHPIAGFIDIQKILTALPVLQFRDSANKILLDESKKIWENLYFMGGEFKDDAFIMRTEINLVDKNINSMKQLNSYFDKVAKVIMEKKKKYNEKWAESDSTIDALSRIDTVSNKLSDQ